MYYLGSSPDLVQIQVRETGVFLERMDIPIQVWHMEVMRKDFNEHHTTQVPMTENQLGEMQMMDQVAEHVRMNYPDTSDSRYVAQPVDNFFFPWEDEMGSAENPITKDEDEGFSETMTPPAPQQLTAMELRPALHSIENRQNSSAARKLFD